MNAEQRQVAADSGVNPFLGRRNFILTGRRTKLWTKGPKPEAQRAESGGKFLGEGSEPPAPPGYIHMYIPCSPPATGSGGALKLP